MNFEGRPVVPTILKRYKAQRTRGINGFGFYIPESNRLTHNVKESRILSLLKREKSASEILLHHRFPTSTANVRNACHPFSTKDFFENNYVVVHNGVVHNPAALKEQHEKLGISYVSKQENGRFNDSEALTYDIALYLEGKTDKLTASGSIAFIAIKRDSAGKPTNLFFARNNNSPLKMKKTEHSLTLSSEGEGDIVETNKLYSYSYDTGEIVKRELEVPGGWTPRANPPYSRPTGTGTWTPPSRSGTPALNPGSSFSSVERKEVENAIAVSSMASGWDNDDELSEIQKRWEESSSIKDIEEDLLQGADYDEGIAIVEGETMLRQLKKRMTHIEDTEEETEILSEDERMELINEYCELEERIRYLSAALKNIRQQIVDAAESRVLKDRERQEVSGEHRIGFQQAPVTPTVPKTGERHAVPTIDHKQTKLLDSRDFPRYAD